MCFLYYFLALLCSTGWCPGSGISYRCGPSSKEKQQQLYKALLSLPGPQALTHLLLPHSIECGDACAQWPSHPTCHKNGVFRVKGPPLLKRGHWG